jgi:hypothetical protein
MPTPRPERSVTFSAVEKPAAKIRATMSLSARTAPGSTIPWTPARELAMDHWLQ